MNTTKNDVINNTLKSLPHHACNYDGDNTISILEKVLPFLYMASESYSNDPIKSSRVSKSFLVNHKANTSFIFGLIPLTSDTQLHVALLDNNNNNTNKKKDDVELALIFRGTELTSLPDILTDIDIIQQRLELYDGTLTPSFVAPIEVKVHQGFLKAFSDVTNNLIEGYNIQLVVEKELGISCDTVSKVWCIGHSLGGALATLCSMWCHKIAFPNLEELNLLTMGSPAVGNMAFVGVVSSLLTHSYRLVNKRDPIPSILHPFLGYHHVLGAIYMYEEEGSLTSTHGDTRPTSFNLCRKDHSINNYINSVEHMLKQKEVKSPSQ